MKTFLFLLFSISLSSITSCNKQLSSSLFNTPCDIDNRKNISLLENQIGIVDEKNLDYIIRLNDKSTLFPCNLPDEFKKQGVSVKFTGYKKKSLPTEKWVGAPFKLVSIMKN